MSYGVAALAIFVLMHVTSLLALTKKRNDYADVIWGPGFVLASGAVLLWKFFFQNINPFDGRSILLFIFVSFWGIRLFLHIGLRTLKKDLEDIRYQNFRKAWGTTWIWRSYLQVFWLQGFFMMIIALPLIVTFDQSPSTQLGLAAFAGMILWILGFLFEAISDHQLKVFTSNPLNKGGLLTSGLWGWSRHPNYFGEVVQWWGIFFIALEVPWGWVTLISPLTMTFLILKVSGIPLLEAHMASRPGFASYAARTPVFFPRPPKKG